MIAILGDLHLRDDQPYWRAVCEAFLDWYREWPINSKGNDLILTGDLVETPVLSGTVVDYLEKLIEWSDFDSIHICVGNHDRKKMNGHEQIAYKFYNNKKKVHLYEAATSTNISGKSVLVLPYFLGTNKHKQTMREFYSNLWNDNKFKKHYDLVVGHFCGSDCVFPGDTGYVDNLEKIDADHIILGHVHTRSVNPDRYIGSVFANKKSENDKTRAAVIIRDDNSRYEERLPVFNEFIAFNYPNGLPESEAVVPIYSVLSCASETVARVKYGDIFIRRTTPDMSDFIPKRNVQLDVKLDSIQNMDLEEMFRSFCKSQSNQFGSEIEEDCLKMLAGRN